MKLLVFSDLHCDKAAATRIVELARGADVAIGAGDFANARTGVSTCIDILKALRIPAVLVPGNNESYDEATGSSSIHNGLEPVLMKSRQLRSA
jgi:predicted phosphodiesterase